MIDFKEIPRGNGDESKKDSFEQFAQDLLESIGFEICQPPARGADGGVDMIILEKRKGVKMTSNHKWLVSCKHFAHSDKSVTRKDEMELIERITLNNCSGFIGFYSTVANNSLITALNKLKTEKGIDYLIYSNTEIEKEIENSLDIKEKQRILRTYFPKYFSTYNPSISMKYDDRKAIRKRLAEIRTALITLEMSKLFNEIRKDSSKLNENLDKIFDYAEYGSYEVTEQLMYSLQSITYGFRNPSIYKSARNITSLIYNFAPIFLRKENELCEEISKVCIDIAYNMIYYSIKYTHDKESYESGIEIIKFINDIGMGNKNKLLISQIEMIESTIDLTLKLKIDLQMRY